MFKLPARYCTFVQSAIPSRFFVTLSNQRAFSSAALSMSDLSIDLKAPNGRKITLPTGIFINNEFIKSSSGEKITSINPTYGAPTGPRSTIIANTDTVATNLKYVLYMPPLLTMSIKLSKPLAKPSETPPGAKWPQPIEAQ